MSKRPGTRQLAKWGRKGGFARAEKIKAARRGPPPPFAGTILDMLDAAGLVGETWAPWRCFWKAVFALPMDPGELELYRKHTGREIAPQKPVTEAWQPIGRRGG